MMASKLHTELAKLEAMGRQLEHCNANARQATDSLLAQLATVQANANEADKALFGFVAWVAATFKTKNVRGLYHLVRAYIMEDGRQLVEEFLDTSVNVTIFSMSKHQPQSPEYVPNDTSLAAPVPLPMLNSPRPGQVPPTMPTEPPPSTAPAPLQVAEQSAVPPQHATPTAPVASPPSPPSAPQTLETSLTTQSTAQLLPASTNAIQSPPAKHTLELLDMPRPSKKAKLTKRSAKKPVTPRNFPTTRHHSAYVDIIALDDDDDENDIDDDKDEDYVESRRNSGKTTSAATDSATDAVAPSSPSSSPSTTRTRLHQLPPTPKSATKRSHPKKSRTAAATHLLAPRGMSTSKQNTLKSTEQSRTDVKEPDVEPVAASAPFKTVPIQKLLHDSMDVDDAASADVSTAVEIAYAAVLEAKPWETWTKHVRSFLLDNTPQRRHWNAKLAHFFEKHAFTLWHRFFYTTALPSKWPQRHRVDKTATQDELFLLAYQLHKVEGDDVFKFLLRAPHPAWPTWLSQPVELRHLKDEDAMAYLQSQASRRWPQASQVHDGDGAPHKDVFDPLAILACMPSDAFLHKHKIPPTWAADLADRLRADSAYNVDTCEYVCVTMFGEDEPVHLPNKVASTHVWDWDENAVVPRSDVV
ncbi:hypothetical protein DYB32_006984 [Aphanomyces invadans]|uniref:Uncharacterized protein n=1 Tax=Aphanomyces invadans TaxID=157072 RepID=A0A418AX97_9STRA|nr:hypothetical protein DYB32_006984 [Aphanomyces invadans]